MKRRKMGQSDLFVSEIGFGCGGNAGLMVRGDAELQKSAVAAALELGINYFDTAPVYGDTASERNLGRALRSLDARPIVATKVALELSDLDDIAGSVIRSVEQSLERLGSDRVELVHLHNRVARQRAAKADIGVGAMLTVEDVLGRNGAVSGLEALAARGLVRYFGCCAYGGEPDAVRSLIDSGKFTNVLVHYSVLNQTAWRAATPGSLIRDYDRIGAYAARAGLGTSVLRVLEGGALAGEMRHPLARDSVTAEYREALERAESLRELRGDREPVTFAIQFALDNPDVSTVLIGFSDAEQVPQAAAASAGGASPEV